MARWLSATHDYTIQFAKRELLVWDISSGFDLLSGSEWNMTKKIHKIVSHNQSQSDQPNPRKRLLNRLEEDSNPQTPVSVFNVNTTYNIVYMNHAYALLTSCMFVFFVRRSHEGSETFWLREKIFEYWFVYVVFGFASKTSTEYKALLLFRYSREKSTE